jgi:hypothetical protein
MHPAWVQIKPNPGTLVPALKQAIKRLPDNGV